MQAEYGPLGVGCFLEDQITGSWKISIVSIATLNFFNNSTLFTAVSTK